MVWALFNLVVGFLLFRAGKVAGGDGVSLVIFFFGIAVLSIMMSVRFQKKRCPVNACAQGCDLSESFTERNNHAH